MLGAAVNPSDRLALRLNLGVPGNLLDYSQLEGGKADVSLLCRRFVVMSVRSQPLRTLIRKCTMDVDIGICIAPGESQSVRVFRD